ncbi:MAG: hypothetical protein HY615_05645 [Candidatus Rokubacteria bacterium]|nr:hypothetical protein [Candidatus Rokubacteria bacterium]
MPKLAGENVTMLLEGWRYHLLMGISALLALYAALGVSAEAPGGAAMPRDVSLYVVNFAVFVGAGAGMLLIVALADRSPLAIRGPTSRVAQPVAISVLMLGGAFAVLEATRPDHPVTGSVLQLPTGWDLLIVLVDFAIVTALGYIASRVDVLRWVALVPRARRKLEHLLSLGHVVLSPVDPGGERQVVARIAAASLPASLLLYAMAVSLLRVTGVRAAGPVAMIAPIFVVPALVSGMALGLAAATFRRNAADTDTGHTTDHAAGRLLLSAIPVLGIYLLGEILVLPYARGRYDPHVVAEMLLGGYGLLVWAGFAGGVMVPFLILVRPCNRGSRGTGLAALLVVAGILAAQWHIAFAGAVGHAHLATALRLYSPPPWAELSSMAAAYALAALACAFMIGRRPAGSASGSP